MTSQPSSHLSVLKEEKPLQRKHEVMAEHRDLSADQDIVEVICADGTVGYLDSRIVGGELESMPKGYFRSFSFIGTVTAQCLASICAYLGWVLPANTLSLIGEDLGDSSRINWVATVWLLGSCIGFLLVGRLSDIYGRRWIVLGTAVLSLVGCVVSACAQNVGALIAGSLCNGISAAGQLSFQIFLGELVPNKYRGLLMDMVFFSSFPFAVFGGLIARLFINNTTSGWRWSYYLGIICGSTALVLYLFCYHPPTYKQLHANGKSGMQQLKDTDFIGISLFISGCVLFLIGLSWGGTTYPWASAQTLCPLVIGIFTLVVFGMYEGKWCRSEVIMPPRLFRNIGYSAIVIIASVGYMVYASFTVLWPTIISSIYTSDSIQVGLQSAVVGGGVLLGQLLGGVAISCVPGVKIQSVVFACLTIAFITPLATLGAGTHTMTIVLGILACTSLGFLDNISYVGVTLVFGPQDIGLATGILGSLRGMAGAVAEALYSSVLNDKLASYLTKYVTPAATAAGLPDSSIPDLFTAISGGTTQNLSPSTVPGMDPDIAAAVKTAMAAAYAHSFRIVFLCTLPFTVILLISTCLLPDLEKSLSRSVAKRLKV